MYTQSSDLEISLLGVEYALQTKGLLESSNSLTKMQLQDFKEKYGREIYDFYSETAIGAELGCGSVATINSCKGLPMVKKIFCLPIVEDPRKIFSKCDKIKNDIIKITKEKVIVDLYAANRQGIYMEKLNKTWKQMIDYRKKKLANGEISLNEARLITLGEISSILKKIGLLHKAGYVHLDFHDDNIMSTNEGDMLIIDMDFAMKFGQVLTDCKEVSLERFYKKDLKFKFSEGENPKARPHLDLFRFRRGITARLGLLISEEYKKCISQIFDVNICLLHKITLIDFKKEKSEEELYKLLPLEYKHKIEAIYKSKEYSPEQKLEKIYFSILEKVYMQIELTNKTYRVELYKEKMLNKPKRDSENLTQLLISKI